MKDIRAYLEISVEKELPKEDGVYFTFTSQHGQSKGLRRFENGKFDDGLKYDSIYFLKQFSLPELMEEAIREYTDLYLKCVAGKLKLEMPSREEFINDFLTQKGIIEESGPDWDALNDFPNKAF